MINGMQPSPQGRMAQPHEVRSEDELRHEAERQVLVARDGYTPRRAEGILQARRGAETRASLHEAMKSARVSQMNELDRLADEQRRLRQWLAQRAELQAIEDARVQAARVAGRPVGPQLNAPEGALISID